jgi:hypothetical protein
MVNAIDKKKHTKKLIIDGMFVVVFFQMRVN